MHTYAIVCGVGILNKHKWRCCRLSFPLRNIYVIHMIIAGAATTMLFLWIFSDGQTNFKFSCGATLWVYLGLVVVQFLLRIHFQYYNSHLKRIRSL